MRTKLSLFNFRHRVLKRTEGLEYSGPVLWDVSLCNLLAWFIIFLVLTKGVQTLGKVDISFYALTVNFLNIRTNKKFVVITLIFELCGSTIE